MTLHHTLRRLFGVIEKEAAVNPAFAQALAEALALPPKKEARKARREPAAFDPVHQVAAFGEVQLREKLMSLSLSQLKDIVAAHGMDPAKLAMKWTSEQRLIDHIIVSSISRSKKGDAFRN